MSADDRLAALRAQLGALDDRELASHPQVLEQVHREMVAELEELEDLERLDDEDRHDPERSD